MQYLFKLIFLGITLFQLVACSTTNTPTEDEKNDIETSKINTQLGLAYLERHDLQRAKQKLLLAMEEAPTIPEPYYSMGYFMEATGNKTQANAFYLKAIKVAPGRGDVLNNYGTFLCRSGQYKASIQYFIQAVNDPKYLDSAGAYENAGLCALKIPNKNLAAKYFRMALRENPKQKVSIKKLAELNHKEDGKA